MTLFMKKFVLFACLITTIFLAPSCKKDRTCHCTATRGLEMLDFGYFTGKKTCSEPEKETQGYAEDGWIMKCVEVEVDDNVNLNNN